VVSQLWIFNSNALKEEAAAAAVALSDLASSADPGFDAGGVAEEKNESIAAPQPEPVPVLPPHLLIKTRLEDWLNSLPSAL
jgi:hypothetical protein